MKLKPCIFILLMPFTSCGDHQPNSNNASVHDPTGVQLSGKDVFLPYSHGGPLAQIHQADFEISNSLQREASVAVKRASFVKGTRDTAGVLDIREATELTLTKCVLHPDTVNVIQEVFLLEPQQDIKIQITFVPISTEISYHDNYQAIRLELMANGELVKVDSKLAIEREDDLDKH